MMIMLVFSGCKEKATPEKNYEQLLNKLANEEPSVYNFEQTHHFEKKAITANSSAKIAYLPILWNDIIKNTLYNVRNVYVIDSAISDFYRWGWELHEILMETETSVMSLSGYSPEKLLAIKRQYRYRNSIIVSIQDVEKEICQSPELMRDANLGLKYIHKKWADVLSVSQLAKFKKCK